MVRWGGVRESVRWDGEESGVNSIKFARGQCAGNVLCVHMCCLCDSTTKSLDQMLFQCGYLSFELKAMF